LSYLVGVDNCNNGLMSVYNRELDLFAGVGLGEGLFFFNEIMFDLCSLFGMDPTPDKKKHNCYY